MKRPLIHHGAAQHTDVTRKLFLPANEGYIATGRSSNIDYYGIVLGVANGDEPHVYFTMKIPDDFVSFTKVEAVWVCGAAEGNMYWRLLSYYAANGEDYSTHWDGHAMGTTATGGSFFITEQEPANPLTLGSLAAGDYLGLYFERDGSNVNDTIDANVYLFGLLFTYVGHQ